jgi:hydroxymethylbilane synthase
LTAPLPAEARALVRASAAAGRPLVVDLEGSNGPPAHSGGTAYFGLREVAGLPLCGIEAARIARAEALAFEQALRWHGPTSWTARTIRLGTRSSRLALAQAEELRSQLAILLPDARLELVEHASPGDRDKQTPLPEVRDDDFFTRDLDRSLLRGDIDLAVHSAKDLPARLPRGLRLAAVTPSPAPWECLISRTGAPLSRLEAGARVGTSSARRREMLLAARPDVVPCDVRGDVPDRLRQLDEGRYDALILAAIGLIRLGLGERISEVFAVTNMPPSAGQGSLAVVVREDDEGLAQLLAPLDLGSREGLP